MPAHSPGANFVSPMNAIFPARRTLHFTDFVKRKFLCSGILDEAKDTNRDDLAQNVCNAPDLVLPTQTRSPMMKSSWTGGGCGSGPATDAHEYNTEFAKAKTWK